MSGIGKLRKWWRRHQFRPGILGFLGNPYFLIRRHLWLAIMAEASSHSGRVLDVGCGAKPYRSLFPCTDYVGMDVEVSGHDHQLESIDVFYDGMTFPFSDGEFDSVFISEVLEHVPNAELTLRECRRVLRPGGRLLLTMPFMWGEHEMPYDHRRFTSVGLKALIQSGGFKVESLRPLGGSLETIVQLAADAVLRIVAPWPRIIRAGIGASLACWFNIMGTLCRWLVPGQHGLYLGHVLVAQASDLDLRASQSLETTSL